MQPPNLFKPTTRVREDEASLRERFNRLQIWEKVRDGAYLKRETRRPVSVAWDPDIVESVECVIADHSHPRGPRFIALVHYYLKRDGSIGASGKIDPKMVVEGEVLYHQPKGRRR
jgi:hypothetical protein